MKLLNKKDILDADDIAFEYVEVKEWGGTVKLYAMSLEQQIEFEKIKKTDNSINGEQIIFVLSNAIRDDDGNKLFSPEEAEELLRKSTAVVSRLFMKCAELSKVKTAEELEKN